MEKLPPTISRKSRSASGSIPVRRGDESSHFAEIERLASSEAKQAAIAAKADLQPPGDELNLPGLPVSGVAVLAPKKPVQQTVDVQEVPGSPVAGPSSRPRLSAESFRVERQPVPLSASRSVPPVKAESKIRPANPAPRGPGGRPLHAASVPRP
eukprot:IDg22406t1